MAGESSNVDPLRSHEIRVSTPQGPTPNKIKRSNFPKGFIFGAATSAYQVEGAWNEDGKGESNWDYFTEKNPDKIQGGGNGKVAIDHYHQFEEDVAILKKVGLDSYRFSIAWTRILPGGRLSAGVNRAGVKYYNDLINLLLAQGIIPCVTLFHWDVPQCLDAEYGGFLSPRIVEDFSDYAEVCFWEFGDRVKHWITLNEPWSFANAGYAMGTFAPGRGATRSDHITKGIHPHRSNRGPAICSDGDPATEPYIVAHHLILCHAAAVDLYKKHFQKLQGGKIGITNVTMWFEPLNNTPEDKEAASRALDFVLGWFVTPVVTGDYPPVMRELVGDRLPQFTPEQSNLVKGSYDFLGINYYTTNWATNSPRQPGEAISYQHDNNVELSTVRPDGTPIGQQAGSGWLYIVPEGFYRLMVHIKEKYKNPIIYVTENGVDEVNTQATVSQARFDDLRVKSHHDHLVQLKRAIDHGARVKAYYLWSMFDNFEWADGYTVRFGIIHVDFDNQLKRFPKASAIWWSNFLGAKKVKKTKDKTQQPIKRFLLF